MKTSDELEAMYGPYGSSEAWSGWHKDQPARQHARASVGQPLPAVSDGWHTSQEDRQRDIDRTSDQEREPMIHENITTAIERAKVIARDAHQIVTIWHFQRSRQGLIVESFFILYPEHASPLDYDLSDKLFQPVITYHPNGRAYLSKK